MAALEESQSICRSVFKNGSENITPAEFTKAFAGMINRVEKILQIFE